MPLPDPNDPGVQAYLTNSAVGPLDEPNLVHTGSQLGSAVVTVIHHGPNDAVDFGAASLYVIARGPGTGARALVISAEGTLGDVLQVKNTLMGEAKFVMNTDEETIHREIAYFSGRGIQVGDEVEDLGSGTGVIGMKDMSVVPTTNPTGGVVIGPRHSRMQYRASDGRVSYWPDGNPTPETNNLLAWNFDPLIAVAGGKTLDGKVYMAKIQLHRGFPSPTKVVFYVSDAAPGGTNAFVGIYDTSGTLLATSANTIASMATTGVKVVSLASPPTFAPGDYYVAILSNSAGNLGFATVSAFTGLANANLTAPNLRFCEDGTGMSALPSSVTMGSTVVTDRRIWFGLAE